MIDCVDVQPLMSGHSPLVGVNDDLMGPRFPSTSDAYDRDLQEILLSCAKVRSKYRIDRWQVTTEGHCHCNEAIPLIVSWKLYTIEIVSLTTYSLH